MLSLNEEDGVKDFEDCLGEDLEREANGVVFKKFMLTKKLPQIVTASFWQREQTYTLWHVFTVVIIPT